MLTDSMGGLGGGLTSLNFLSKTGLRPEGTSKEKLNIAEGRSCSDSTAMLKMSQFVLLELPALFILCARAW